MTDSTSSDALPRDLEDFLRAVIESYEHLAVLLLLRRELDRDWSADELAAKSGIPSGLVDSALSGLSRKQLVESSRDESSPRYRYAASGLSDALVTRLGEEFSLNPARLMRLLNSYALERMRTSAIRAFADSFVIKKKDPDRG